MKKLQLLFILFTVMALLALSDYVVTKPNLTLPAKTQSQEVASIASKTDGIVKETLEAHPELNAYYLEKRIRSTNLFEHFNISQLGLESYKNLLASSSLPAITLYELETPLNQGKFAFLNLKLTITSQSVNEASVNITNQFGQSSLFYNDTSIPTTGFLLVQIHDTILGFQYDKNSTESFEYIKAFLKTLNS